MACPGRAQLCSVIQGYTEPASRSSLQGSPRERQFLGCIYCKAIDGSHVISTESPGLVG